MTKDNSVIKIKASIIIFMVIIAFSILFAETSNADNMKNLESELKENEEKQSSFEQEASEIAGQKSSLENLISDLNTEIMRINENIASIEQEIADKNQEIENTRAELSKAKDDEKLQYESMKLRIKYMYESGNDTYIDILISGESISKMLDKLEYAADLNDYDRNMLKKYKETQNEISEKEEALNNEMQELNVLKSELDVQHELISQKIESSRQQVVLYADEIREAEAKALEAEREAERNRTAIEEESMSIEESRILEAQKRERESREAERISESKRLAEEASKALENGESETTSNPNSENPGVMGGSNYPYTNDEIDMLAALIECEAGDQSYYGMLCVGAVVMNRIDSSLFPSTLREVIYQPYQFTPVTVSNRFEIVLARGADETCYKAAREVLVDGHITGTWLFFRMNDGSRQGDIIGDHVFY